LTRSNKTLNVKPFWGKIESKRGKEKMKERRRNGFNKA